MEQSNAIQKYEVPTIEQLYEERELKHKESQLNALLNNPPKKEWIQKHPNAKKEVLDENGRKIQVPTEHLPIARVEWLLSWIFKTFKWEILRESLIGNSVVVTVRMWYVNPIRGEWQFHDGIGAVPLQTEKGAGATDWSQLKSMAVQKGAPAAESFARKNAAKKLGKLFGRDLNRDEDLNYEMMVKRFHKADEEINNLQQDVSVLLDSVEDQEKWNEFKERIDKAEAENRNTIEFYNVLIDELKAYVNQENRGGEDEEKEK